MTYGVGSAPISVAVGDFNRDGKPDLAVANLGSANVSVLLGYGNGVFGSTVNIAVGSNPRAVALGDFNGDGKTDLAVANFSSNNVSILPGQRDGTFGAAVNHAVGTNPYSLAAADFRGNGRRDLVTANVNSNNVSILLGGNCPSLNTIAPDTGPAAGAQTVTIHGANLSGAVLVTFGGSPAAIAANTASSLTVTTPAHTVENVDVVVSAASGMTDSKCRYRFVAPPATPTGVIAEAVSSTRVEIAWNAVADASSYMVERRQPGTLYLFLGTASTNSFSDSTAFPDTAYLYRARGTNAAGTSANSVADLAATVMFTDTALTAGTEIRAVHLAELRTAINAVCLLAGLPAPGFTDSAVPGTTIKAVHVTEMRSTLNFARGVLGLPTPPYTDPSLTSVVVKAVHFEELRDRVR